LPALLGLSALPLGADLCGQVDDLAGIALDALAVKCGCGDAAGAVVGFAVGGDEAFAEQDLHALLSAVLAEGGSFVDKDFADVGRFVEQDDVVGEDFIVGSAAVAAHVFKEADGIAGLEEFVEEVEGEIEAQAGRIEIAAVADEDRRCSGGRRIEGDLLSSHGSSLDDGLVRWFQFRG